MVDRVGGGPAGKRQVTRAAELLAGHGLRRHGLNVGLPSPAGFSILTRWRALSHDSEIETDTVAA